MGFAGYVSVCVQLYCVGFHCLTQHVSAYMAIFRCVGYFIFICLKDSASLLLFCLFFSDKHTRKETTKITKENSTGKRNKWKRAECDHVEKSQKKQRSRILQTHEYKISYTPEDGHVGRNM
jgi:hypothetical protein